MSSTEGLGIGDWGLEEGGRDEGGRGISRLSSPALCPLSTVPLPLPTATRRQRQRDDRHVVDLDRLDDPAGHAGRHEVHVLVDLLVELDQAPLAVLADVVANGDDRLVLAAHRVDVLDAVDLVEHLLQRRGDQLLDLRGRVAGEADVDVGQRHDDLRVFLARRQPQRRQPDTWPAGSESARDSTPGRSSRCGS